MRTVGLGLAWEDLKVGDRFRTLARTITETDLVNFINTTGMVEVLFTDIEYAKTHAPEGGRLVPGALVYSIAEGLLVQSTLQRTGLAFLSMTFEVVAPTFVNDTVHVEVEVLESRATSKSASRGLVRTTNNIINQRGETVITYSPLRLAASRDARDN
ncbi:MAG: MaoC/PaaZ C-terminal domain-containing protein [Gammaproteobacteria bacterium]|nr:MaoC/PaaZ C-terminal domain-containing protein [Gammaproteobacteria bacterium]MCZ6659106.1 MaoC/PaaZ C-terminal domain-containing protein [Gammaproteobacteria bacterium]